jgi:hypothetical protein
MNKFAVLLCVALSIGGCATAAQREEGRIVSVAGSEVPRINANITVTGPHPQTLPGAA